MGLTLLGRNQVRSTVTVEEVRLSQALYNVDLFVDEKSVHLEHAEVGPQGPPGSQGPPGPIGPIGPIGVSTWDEIANKPANLIELATVDPSTIGKSILGAADEAAARTTLGAAALAGGNAFSGGPNTFAALAAQDQLSVLAPSGLTGKLQSWKVNAVEQVSIDAAGKITVSGTGSASGLSLGGRLLYADGVNLRTAAGIETSQLRALALATGTVPLFARGAVGQTANLIEAQDSGGAVKAAIAPDGRIGVGTVPSSAVGITLHGASDFSKVKNNGYATTIDFGYLPGTGLAMGDISLIAGTVGASKSVGVSLADAAASFKVVQNHATPTVSALRVIGGDAETEKAGAGLILKSPDGLLRRKLTIDNTGNIQVNAV